MPLNQDCIGKTYPPSNGAITPAAIAAYARACNEVNPRYFAGAGAQMLAPPMFAAVITWIPLLTALTDPALGADLIRLLHTAQSMEFFAPMRPGEVITSTARISAIETVASGESITVELAGARQDGTLLTRIGFTALIRARRRASSGSDAEGGGSVRSNPIRVTETIDLDQTTRYAEASGDRNPIHVDPGAAKLAGLPGIVVHGLCTMAFACRAMVDHACGGEPSRLRRIAAAFSRPVFPGDALTTSMWRDRGSDANLKWEFETVNDAGLTVLRDGGAEVEE